MRNVLRNSAALIAAGMIVGLLTVGPVPELLVREAKERSLDELSWLIGCWRHESPRGTVMQERWRRVSADTLWGASVTLRGDSIIASERLHIVLREQTFVYIAVPSGQQRAEFTASTAHGYLAVFENAVHDFPQRIIYRPAGDSLHARIDGIVEGALRAIDFPMVRTACTTS